jgi:hypothetical protein
MKVLSTALPAPSLIRLAELVATMTAFIYAVSIIAWLTLVSLSWVCLRSLPPSLFIWTRRPHLFTLQIRGLHLLCGRCTRES